MKRCKNSRRHKRPFFTVLAFAREVGRGSREPGYRRAVRTKRLTTLCGDCLREARIELEGKDLVPCTTKE